MRKVVTLAVVIWSIVAGVSSRAAEEVQVARPQGEEALRKRIEAFWDARKSNRLDECYSMFTEESKKSCTLVQYIKRSNIITEGVNSIEVKFVAGIDGAAVAVIDYRGNVMGQVIEHMTRRQEWFWESGAWKVKVINPPKFPMPGPPSKPTSGGSSGVGSPAKTP